MYTYTFSTVFVCVRILLAIMTISIFFLNFLIGVLRSIAQNSGIKATIKIHFVLIHSLQIRRNLKFFYVSCEVAFHYCSNLIANRENQKNFWTTFSRVSIARVISNENMKYLHDHHCNYDLVAQCKHAAYKTCAHRKRMHTKYLLCTKINI